MGFMELLAKEVRRNPCGFASLVGVDCGDFERCDFCGAEVYCRLVELHDSEFVDREVAREIERFVDDRK